MGNDINDNHRKMMKFKYLGRVGRYIGKYMVTCTLVKLVPRQFQYVVS
jgi:hypothetical protein